MSFNTLLFSRTFDNDLTESKTGMTGETTEQVYAEVDESGFVF